MAADATASPPGGAPTFDAGPILAAMPLVPADDLGALLALVEDQLPAGTRTTVLLSDYQESVVSALGAAGVPTGEEVSLEGTLGGRAFRTQECRQSADALTAWVPLTNRWRRLGLLRLDSDGGLPPGWERQALPLAHLTATLLDSATRCTDAFYTAKRRYPITVTAEMQWELLPPLSVAAEGFSVAGRLEPAYDVGGDAFDYAVTGRTAQLAIFDPLGHDLRSALLAALVVGTYRHARRSGAALAETSRELDAAVVRQFPDSCMVTGQLFELDLDTGELCWVNAGHPLPLLLRDGTANEIAVGPDPPWGMRHPRGTVGRVSLQPGDRLLLYTDGATEARGRDGDQFGLQRLVDLLTVHANDDESPAELLRRVLNAVIAHRDDALADDASAVLVHWRGPRAESALGG